MNRLRLLVPALVFATACSVVEPTSATSAARRAAHVTLQIYAESGDLALARVEIAAIAEPGPVEAQPRLRGPELLWAGRADDAGQVDITVFPTHDRAWLEVTAFAPGFGAVDGTGPAASIQVPVDAAEDLRLSLAPAPSVAEGPLRIWPGGMVQGPHLDGWTPTTVLVIEPGPVSVEVLHVDETAQVGLGYFIIEASGEPTPNLEGQPILGEVSEGLGAHYLLDAQGAPRLFEVGQRIGLFVGPAELVAQGELPSLDPVDNFVRDFVTTSPSLNPEVARLLHAAARRTLAVQSAGKSLVGFELSSRAGAADDDFDDLVLVVEGKGASAIEISGAEAMELTALDADGDGVPGLADAFPADLERAAVVRLPARGQATLALELDAPYVEDADYNDAVVHHVQELVLDPHGRVRELVGTYYRVAQGAEVQVDLRIDVSLPERIGGRVEIERVDADGAHRVTHHAVSQLRDAVGPEQLTLRDVLPAGGSGPYNVSADGWRSSVPMARIRVVLDAPVTLAELGPSPLVPVFEVHGAGVPETFAGPAALDLPCTWRHPLEGVPVLEAYPNLSPEALAQDLLSEAWYRWPSGAFDQVVDPFDLAVAPTTWTVRPGA